VQKAGPVLREREVLLYSEIINAYGGITFARSAWFCCSFLVRERRYTKGQVLKAAEAIASESEGLGLSYDELLEGFRALVEEVSSTTGCISRFNEPGGPDSPPFLVFNWEALRSAVREHLELLSSKAPSFV
jgi:hypothetical protein